MFRTYEPDLGADIHRACAELCRLAASDPDCDGYEMTFNDVKVSASHHEAQNPDAPEALYRTWSAEMDKLRAEAEGRHKAWLQTPEGIEAARKQAAKDTKRAEIRESGPPAFRCVDEDAWKSWVDANQDGYGRACILYAAYWASLMDAAMVPADDSDPLGFCSANADRFSHEADVEGITGFMYGCAVQMLSRCWVHGEALRRWHNKEWGAPEDAKGVVNPAILTLG